MAFVVAMFEGVDIQSAGLVAPKISSLFGLSAGQLGWFFSASTIGLVFGALAGGRLGDRAGRKVSLIASVVVFGVFSFATAFSSSLSTLVVARLLTGVGLGGALPNLIALAAEGAPGDRRLFAVSLMYSGMPLGAGLAGLLLGLSPGGGDWRTIFEVGGIAPLALVPLIMVVLPESREFRTSNQAIGSRNSVTEALFSGGRLSRTLVLWAGFFCCLLVLYLLLNWLPSLLVSRGLSRSQASIAQGVFNGTGAAGSVLMGVLMEGAFRRLAVAFVFLGLASSLAAVAILPATFPVVLFALSAVGLTTLGSQVAFYNLAPSVYPIRSRGTGLGAAVAAGRIGSVMGPLLAGILLGQGKSSSQVLMSLLPLVIIAGGLGWFLAGRKASSEEVETTGAASMS